MVSFRPTMGRRAAPLVPRKIVVNGDVQWVVRVPLPLRKQEGVKDVLIFGETFPLN